MSLMDVHTKPLAMFEDIISGSYEAPVFPTVGNIPTSPVLPDLIEPKMTKPNLDIDAVMKAFSESMAMIDATAKQLQAHSASLLALRRQIELDNMTNDTVRPEWVAAGYKVITKAAALDLLDVVAGAHPGPAGGLVPGARYFAAGNPKEGVCALGVMFALLGYEKSDLRRHNSNGDVPDDVYIPDHNRSGITIEGSGVYPGTMRITPAAAIALANAQVRSDQGMPFTDIARDVRALFA